MKRIGTTAALLVAAVLVPVSAYSAKKAPTKAVEVAPTKWVQEPDGFLGIKFGEPFPTSVPDCPMLNRYVDFEALRRLPGICFEGESRKTFGKIWNTPDLGITYSVDVMMDNGVPTSFTIDTKPEYFGRLEDALIKRYGPPQLSVDNKVQSGAGAEFDNRINRWRGDRVTIDSYMRHDEVGKSETFIGDKVYWNKKQQESDSKSAVGASQL